MSDHCILLVSHDTRGMGSFRRQCKIAEALRALAPSLEILLATSSGLRAPSFVQVLELPPFQETQLRSSLLLRYVQEFAPNAILVDKHPFGVSMDSKAALFWAIDNDIVCFYGLRDILDHPERIRAEWNRLSSQIERCFRKVLVYGEQELFDVEQYGLLPAQVEYCGFVAGSERGRSAASGVLCTVGAGDCKLAAAVLATFEQCHFSERSTIVRGPYAKCVSRNGSSHTTFGYCASMHEQWTSHRCVVCLGGYNTLVEAMSYGLQIVCIPRTEPRLEQLMRARLFSERGWIEWIHPDDLTVGVVQESVHRPPTSRQRPALAGAEIAARAIIREARLHP